MKSTDMPAAMPNTADPVDHDVDAEVSKRTSPKLLALDGLRGIAVLAVMACHYYQFLPDVRWLAPVRLLMLSGWIGVDLFFVLSGFLITGILLRTRLAANYFSAFYMRRFLRIFPLYYAVLTLIVLAAAVRPDWHLMMPPANEWPYYYLYVDNWLTLAHNDWPWTFIGHFWTLAIEEQFYLFWPLVIWLLASPRSVGRFAIAGCVLALALRIAAAAYAGPVTVIAYTRFDALLAGAIAAVIVPRLGLRLERAHLARWAVLPLGLFFAGALVLGSHAQLFVRTVGYSLLAVAFALITISAVVHVDQRSVLHRVCTYRPLRLIGRYSYGLYVYHVPVVGVLELAVYNRLPAAMRANLGVDAAFIAVLFLVTFGIARTSYERFEAPLLSLKRYFEPALHRPVDNVAVQEVT